MADKIILADTSVLIDYYRKTNKANSFWVTLIDQGYEFAVSVITKYELYSGATENQINFWDSVMASISVFPLDENCVDSAVNINIILKRKRKQIDLADLFIAATAITKKMPVATLNRKHFDRVDELILVD